LYLFLLYINSFFEKNEVLRENPASGIGKSTVTLGIIPVKSPHFLSICNNIQAAAILNYILLRAYNVTGGTQRSL